jgi:hypothetical protein
MGGGGRWAAQGVHYHVVHARSVLHVVGVLGDEGQVSLLVAADRWHHTSHGGDQGLVVCPQLKHVVLPGEENV